MNIGLTSSFIVAGILLLSILSMNRNISQSSTELTMRQITQLRSNTVTEILQKDIPNIGSDINSSIASPIKDAQTDRIEFESNIDNTGAIETIVWDFTSTPVSNTNNPNDRVLTRSVDGTTYDFKTGITDFRIIYLDANRDTVQIDLISKLLGNNQAERDKIRFIEIEIKSESEVQVGGAGFGQQRYLESSWKKQFNPINLSL